MKTFRTLACIAGVIALSGCSQMGQLLRETNEFQAQQPAQRNYFTDPYVAPVLPTTPQPSWGSAAGEEYRTIMVNTPQGVVYKRCKVLNGQVVACF